MPENAGSREWRVQQPQRRAIAREGGISASDGPVRRPVVDPRGHAKPPDPKIGELAGARQRPGTPPRGQRLAGLPPRLFLPVERGV